VILGRQHTIAIGHATQITARVGDDFLIAMVDGDGDTAGASDGLKPGAVAVELLHPVMDVEMGAAGRVGPAAETDVTVRAMIFSLGRFGIVPGSRLGAPEGLVLRTHRLFAESTCPGESAQFEDKTP
jgi:hypothetical protein